MAISGVNIGIKIYPTNILEHIKFMNVESFIKDIRAFNGFIIGAPLYLSNINDFFAHHN